MAMGRREKDIQLLVAKFIKLVESLNPGERLSIKKVAATKRASVGKSRTKSAKASASKKRAKDKLRRAG